MEAASERRSVQDPRVPLDNVLVEVAPEGFVEGFEADGVNVGPGGLSMRSAILPDVGSRLRCRFNSPHDGTSVDADCEVVWAQDSGPNLGEFGLRFTELGDSDAASIQRLVDAWHTTIDEPEGGAVTLHLEGVGQPVEAELVHRATDALLVEQPLPFLKIGTGIEESGRRGHLAAVDLRIDDGVPRLVLTIGYEPAAVMDVPLDAEATLMDAPAPSVDDEVSLEAAATVEARDAIEDSIDPSFDLNGDLPEAGSRTTRTSERSEARSVIGGGGLGIDLPGETVAAEEPSIDDSFDEAIAAEDAEALASFRSSHGLRLHRTKVVVKSHAAKARVWFVTLWAKASPALRAWWAKARHFGGDLGRRTSAWVRVLRSKAKRTSDKPRKAARATRTPKKRRTTRVPKSRDAAPGPRVRVRVRLRWVLLALIAAGGTYALVGRAEPEATANKLPKAADPELGDEVAAPVIAEPAPAPAPVEEVRAEPETAEPVEVEPPEPGMPRAMAEPSRSAGQMPAPSFPTLGSERPSEPGTVPANSPYAVDVRSNAPQSFGLDEVAGGEQFRIRMSRAPGGLQGEVTDDGFRVVVSGATAEEGAMRIARVHPDVRTARIENEGDRTATLSVRFVSGRRPPYRVHISGQALFVTLGR
ncbi:MAG: PilZ domain-containing protein [Myxococcota bacterium]